MFSILGKFNTCKIISESLVIRIEPCQSIFPRGERKRSQIVRKRQTRLKKRSDDWIMVSQSMNPRRSILLSNPTRMEKFQSFGERVSIKRGTPICLDQYLSRSTDGLGPNNKGKSVIIIKPTL